MTAQAQASGSTAHSHFDASPHDLPSSSRMAGSSRSVHLHRDTPQSSTEDEDVEAPRAWWQGASIARRGPRASGRGNGKGKGKAKAAPYEVKGVHVGQDILGRSQAYCVEFFPFVGPRRPPKTRGWKTWDCWEDAAVYCAAKDVIVGRCVSGPNGDGWEVIWQCQLGIEGETGEGEFLFHVTWTLNPFNLHPIVITAGKTGLIYVLDVIERRVVRVLRGHGDEVQSLAICPTQPHILASGSRDQSVRIWNLYGHEIELPPDKLPNQNYPQGDADEGNHLVAILCGQWPAGHRDDVAALAWHNNHRAIATASRDQSFKIWIVPPLPPPVVPKPAINYRPELVMWPIFSTNRVSYRPLDSIAWLSEDILIAKTAERVITFQWLGYRRYFDYDRWDPLGDDMGAGDAVNWFDVDDSRSIMIISELVLTPTTNVYSRFGMHTRFRPTAEEKKKFDSHPKLVQDFLLAVPQANTVPDVVLYAPTLAPPDPVPKLETKLRTDIDDIDAQCSGQLKGKQESELPPNKKIKRDSLITGASGSGQTTAKTTAVTVTATTSVVLDQSADRPTAVTSHLEMVIDGAPPSPATISATEAGSPGQPIKMVGRMYSGLARTRQKQRLSGIPTPGSSLAQTASTISPAGTKQKGNEGKGGVATVLDARLTALDIDITSALDAYPTPQSDNGGDTPTPTPAKTHKRNKKYRATIAETDDLCSESDAEPDDNGHGTNTGPTTMIDKVARGRNGGYNILPDDAGGSDAGAGAGADDVEDDVQSEPSDIDDDYKNLDLDLRSRPERQYRWQLSVPGWETKLRKHPHVSPQGLTKGQHVVQCCAISPRGAKWILGVGDAKTLFVWRLKE